MSANIRIAQQLSTGYNPDGLPGTVSTGVPGPGPTDDQLMAAVESYLMVHPIPGGMGSDMGVDTAPLTKHGVGADGSTGAWVGVGDNGSTVSGYVVAGGSLDDVDLHLVPKGAGRVFLDGPIAGSLTVNDVYLDGDIQATEPGIGNLRVNSITCADSMTEIGPGIQSWLQNAMIGSSTFDGGSAPGFNITNTWVSIQPYGGQGNPVGVSIWNPISSVYAAIKASAFTVSSDRRWKSEISDLTGALEEVRTTPARSYVMNGEQRRGLIADESPAALVHTDENGYQLIESYDMVATLWGAVRELADQLKGMEQTCRCPQTR